jgi:site-specific recombinase XerC
MTWRWRSRRPTIVWPRSSAWPRSPAYERCEIARLDWAEVGLREQPPMLRVLDGKGGHSRILTLAPALADLLTRLPGRHGPVIVRGDGKLGHNTPATISQMANTFLHSVGVAESLHCGRHRFGTQTYRACQDIQAVREVMGHANISSTQIYTSASPTVARDAVLAASVLQIA